VKGKEKGKEEEEKDSKSYYSKENLLSTYRAETEIRTLCQLVS
jgi:hypothetical protein